MTVFLVIILIMYIFQGIVYSELAKKYNIGKSWLAWVPYGIYYITAKVARLPDYIWILPIVGTVIMNLTLPQPLQIVMVALMYSYFIWADRELFKVLGKSPNMAFFHLLPVFGSLIVLISISKSALCKYRPELDDTDNDDDDDEDWL